MTTQYDILAALRRRPSSALWRLALRHLVAGTYDFYLSEIGGVEEFVRINIAESGNQARAQEAFSSALEYVVVSWQASVPAAELHFERHIELVSAFLPAAGFHKLLGQFESSGFFPTLPSRSLRVDRMGLLAMAHYFASHPIAEASDPAFLAYARFLRKSLTNPDFAAHACRRLLELNLLSPLSTELLQLMRERPELILPELLRMIFLSKPSIGQTLLSTLFSHALTFQILDLFAELLGKIDARIIEGEDRPMIRFRDKEDIPIDLTIEIMRLYLSYTWAKQGALARGKID
ncbi:MAG TPA: hypothetical protein VJ723_11855, partial [Candidatus Angelobacter sp.]|nr:hypothetical protein [Candidatus Angelobacter sp.]